MPKGSSGVIRKGSRGLVRGVGINDSTQVVRENRLAFTKWSNMLRRCSEDYWEIKPTYANCCVCEEWKRFSNFLAWFNDNYVEGWHLDKDLLVRGNKEYSPNTCCFVPPQVNSFLTTRAMHRGKYPLGVIKIVGCNAYRGVITFRGVRTDLGCHKTPEIAHKYWQEVKATCCKVLAEEYKDHPKVAGGLLRIARDIMYEHDNNLITEVL